MKTRNDILPLIAAVTFAITTLQGATHDSSPLHPGATSGQMREYDSSTTLAGVGVDISKARATLAVALINRLEGKGVDIS